MSMRNNRPWTQQELDEYGKEYCIILQNRVQKHRRESNNRRYGQWDIPKVVVACASRIAPFDKERGHNCENLRNPHPVLHASYPSVKNEYDPPQYPGEPHYPEGHCAEPHAAHRVLNQMDGYGKRVQIADLEFGNAYSVKYETIKPYCATCKLTFPQLR